MGVLNRKCILDISYFINIEYCSHFITDLGSADKLFNLCAEFAADSTRKKVQIMPLQNTVLILCPVSLIVILWVWYRQCSWKFSLRENFHQFHHLHALTDEIFIPQIYLVLMITLKIRWPLYCIGRYLFHQD